MQTGGIKLIALLHWLRALIYVAGGLAILGVGHLGTRMISAIANDTPLNRMASGVANTLGVGALVIALIWFALGIGVWSLKNWARVVTLVLSGISALYQLTVVASFHTSWHAFRLMIDVAIVIYLMLPDVKRAFGVS